MIVVIGILVDDGIVIAENIYRHYEKGKTPKQAAVDGTLEVLPAIVSAIVTTIIAFSTLLLPSSICFEWMELSLLRALGVAS